MSEIDKSLEKSEMKSHNPGNLFLHAHELAISVARYGDAAASERFMMVVIPIGLSRSRICDFYFELFYVQNFTSLCEMND